MELREREWLLTILGKGGEQGGQQQSSLLGCMWIVPGKNLILIFPYAKPLEKGKWDRKGVLYAFLGY